MTSRLINGERPGPARERKASPPAPAWYADTKRFEEPSVRRAVLQLVNTVLPLAAIWVLMVLAVRANVNFGFVFLMAIPAAGFMVRLFIFFHDCTHGSFFRNKTANSVLGTILGVLTFTGFRKWRKSHGTHHAGNANLEKRGVGDVWTMTMKEYSEAKPSRRFLYRMYRHPVFLFLIVPPVLFFIINRFPGRRDTARENSHTWMSNLILAAIVVAIGFLLGWDVLWQVHLMIFAISSVIGVWLFYVQHQFDPGYWMHEDDWNAYDAALQGSSHYRLPKVLQWFSGNIGFHHIHHLRPRIPNYNLESCYKAVKELQLPRPLTLWTSLRCMTLNIWEEASERLITFRQARRLLPRLTARTRLAT